jgi:DNA ligase-1
MNTLAQEFETLYGNDKNGKTKIWRARVYVTPNGFGISEIEHGQLNGKLQLATREYNEGKNIGKKNETTPLQQCINETQRKWQDKKEKEGYTTVMASGSAVNDNDDQSVEETSEPESNKIFPMLAHKYEPTSDKKKKNDIVYPCYVQPKLDGLRCITYMVDGVIKNQSRTGAFFDFLGHINVQLAQLFQRFPSVALDGELYTNEMPFESLVGIIKKKKLAVGDQERLSKVKFHIYDVIDKANPNNTYAQRYGFIMKEVSRLNPRNNLEVVRTELVSEPSEFNQLFSEFVEEGYEGIMLRNVGGVYRQNYRSHDLQKYKEFLEDEYPIVGFKEGDGRDKGTVIWMCKTKDERVFSVRPKGTMELRRELFANGEKYIGKQLTVIYQELSELNVPRFPVGKAIRDGY